MKRNLLFAFLIFIIADSAHAQLSGYLKESFEGSTFPPNDWKSYNKKGTSEWASVIFGFTGEKSAYIAYDPDLGKDWLVMPEFTVTSGDSLSFWLAKRFSGFVPDSLIVKISTTGPGLSSFTTDILVLAEGDNYPTTSLTWQKYSVDLEDYVGQNVHIAFYHYDKDGDGVLIDEVLLGTPPEKDIEIVSINQKTKIPSGVSVTPKVTIKNIGSKTHTFNVKLRTNSYASEKTVTALKPGVSRDVVFDAWTPSATGDYGLQAVSTLVGDADLTNDTLKIGVQVYNSFANEGWIKSEKLPNPKWAQGTVAYSKGVFPNDTAYITTLGGANGNFAFDNTVLSYSSETGVWSSLPNVPLTRLHGHAYYYGGKIFYIGGYNPNFSPVGAVSIYNIATSTWSNGASIPEPVGDYAGCQYNDSLIYIIGGYNGNKDVNTVQLYNAASNTWQIASKVNGVPASGLRAGVADNKIIVVGGYSQTLSSTQSQVNLGVIDPLNPINIAWSRIGKYPGGSSGRLSATGIKNSKEALVYFTGGDPNGAGTETQTGTWAYDVNSNEWKIGPEKPTGVSNVVDFSPFVLNDTVYLASIGGYDGSGVVKVNQWLVLGKVSDIKTSKSPNKQVQTYYTENRSVNNDLKGFAVLVYPNPSRGLVNISLQNGTDKATDINVRVNGLSGKMVKSETKHIEKSLNLTYTLSPGTYVIQMQTVDGKWIQSQKLIVN